MLSEKYKIHPFSTPVGRTAYYADDVRPIIAALQEKLSGTQEFAKSCVENANRQFEEIEALQKQVEGLRDIETAAREFAKDVDPFKAHDLLKALRAGGE